MMAPPSQVRPSGEVAEEEVADRYRADQLHVLERRRDVGRRMGERPCDQVVADRPDHAQAAVND